MNAPIEPGAWDADFSYAYLAKLYAALKSDFVPALIGDAEGAAPATGRRAFVRHDLDVSLTRALPLARKEAEWGVPSTYHVMIDSPFYDLVSPRSKAALTELARLGHEIGLHYDLAARRMKEADPIAREADIERACGELEALLGAPVRSLSFHRPVQELVNGPLRVAGRVSGYGKELFGWYISDSRARWREGEPLVSLGKPRAESLQILIHPIWWGEAHAHPGHRLREFLVEIGGELGGTYDELRERLYNHIFYRAADPT